MLLKQLELQGFKTFPDKTTLNFQEGITVVVGPNGSGKSNISDAIRWVLGEQSARILRCSKMEDVIFNGTTSRKSQGYARVTLSIDNKDRRLPFNEDVVNITRRYYRSGESEYLINKATVRLKDINELFMDTGLGRDGYSIIGQGKIDEIVSSKAGDRREIFEEAAGISRYRYRKIEAQHRLDKAEENLVRLRDILNELEERVKSLKIQSEKAKEYLDLSHEKQDLEIGIWVYSLQKTAKTLGSLDEKIIIANKQSEDINKQLEEIRAQNESAYNNINLCIVKADEIRKNIEETEKLASEKNRELAVIKNNVLHFDEKINNINKEIKTSTQAIDNFDENINQNNTKIEGLNKNIKTIEDEILNFKEEIFKIQEIITSSVEKNKVFNDEYNKLNEKLSEIKIKTSSSKAYEVEIKNQLEQNKIKLEQITKKDEQLTENKEELVNEQLKVKENIVLNQNKCSGIELKLKNKEEQLNKLKEEINLLNLDVKEKQRRISILLDMEKNLEGFQKSVKAIIKQKNNGTIAGIHGPVSKLFNVEAKYAIAIETALGGAMQHIVVENDQNARSCINYLKQNKIGRATFLPINTIKGRYINLENLSNMPGFVGVAAQLCTCAEKYKNIISSLLGGIVIATDLNSATDMARKNAYKTKIVTLDGQVINAGGSFTGGALIKNAGILSRSAQIENLKTDINQLNEKLKTANKKLEEDSASLSFEKNELLKYKEILEEFSSKNIKLNSKINNIEFLIKENKTNLENSQTEIKKLENRLDEIQIESDSNKANILKINERIQNLESKMQVSSTDNTKLLSKKDSLSELIQKKSMEKLEISKDIQAIEVEIKNFSLRKNEKNSLINNYKLEINEINGSKTSLQEEIGKLTHTSKDLNKKVEDYKLEIEKINNERLKLEEKNTDFRKKEQNKLDERELIVRELVRLEEKKGSLQTNYDDIIAKLWDTYELTKSEAQEKYANINNFQEAQVKLNKIKNKIKALGNVNVAAVEEYKEINARYEFMKSQVEDIEVSKREILHLIKDLTSQMKEIFEKQFKEINKNFNQTYRELTNGGSAKLVLSTPEDILDSGIEIEAQPKGKIVTRLELLSGGEKALVAISLYFAIMKVNPAPFCILDEIEAALDDVNVDRFAAYLKRMNTNTQFVAITHRRGTMEGADTMYGVTMQEQGVSKLLNLDLNDINNTIN